LRKCGHKKWSVIGQIWEYLQGQYSLLEAQQRAVAATRQLAKRQLTWLRHTAGLTWWINPGGDPAAITAYVNRGCKFSNIKLRRLSVPGQPPGR